MTHWSLSPPEAFSIVACYYPTAKIGNDEAGQRPKLRPALVTKVVANADRTKFACSVAYGTTQLKIPQRSAVDLVFQNHDHLRQLGLRKATRFDLDQIILLPWNESYFDCWWRSSSPLIGKLDEDDIRDFAFKMLRRRSR